jgi:uncharacterized OB-fold protein
MTGDGRIVPVTDDIDTAPFFDAARRGELVVQVCDDCGQPLHLPRQYCFKCGGWNTSWRSTNGYGRVYSWTVVTHQVLPAYPVPHTLVLVELEEYPEVRLVGHLDGDTELTAGQRMKVWFDDISDGVVIPQWTPTGKPEAIDA